MTSRDRLGDCEPEDLGVERNRLVNRLREQLWRYFPALLELEDNLGAEWLLELWEAAPTPDTASRLREATIAKLLKRHRIRRFDAAFVANTLCRPPVRVAAETVEAASASPDLENSETVDPVAVRLARRKTECWANVSQCPVYVETSQADWVSPTTCPWL